MGYTTELEGVLSFTTELKASQLASIKKYISESYTDLELADDFTGIECSNSEEIYDMAEKINSIIIKMKKVMPEFGLKGKVLAQGEDIKDRYKIIIEDGVAVKVDLEPLGKKAVYPHCEMSFYLE